MVRPAKLPLPLRGTRVLSLALNLPGPAALLRCRQMGATCVKLEPPSGDPMGLYSKAAYDTLHQGVRIAVADLKTAVGQEVLQRELMKADVLLTSFRPSALSKLGLDWKALHKLYPALSQVAIVGAPGAAAEEPGHDLTYLAAHDLVTGLDLPATLFADMSGSLMASEAVLQAVLQLRSKGKGIFLEVALSSAAAWLALPRSWGLTKPGGAVGGGHAGYRVYPCLDGRVAVAALEPHFASTLCATAGMAVTDMKAMFEPATHAVLANWFANQTRQTLDKIATDSDIPLQTMPAT
jgi:alpha-methylacyl-CoA racemase